MNTKNIIIILLVFAGLAGLMFWGKSAQKTKPIIPDVADKMPGSLTASEASYDFGVISMKNGKVNYSFKISNLTNDDVILEKVTTSCMCTVAYIVNGENKKGPFGMPGHGPVPKANEVIKAGESRDIEVVFDPNAHGPAGVGKTKRVVWLEYSGGEILEFNIKAIVTP